MHFATKLVMKFQVCSLCCLDEYDSYPSPNIFHLYSPEANDSFNSLSNLLKITVKLDRKANE